MNKIWQALTSPIRWWKERRAYKKRLAEIRRRDPFIYK